MKNIYHHILLATVAMATFISCAKQSSPTGGPKDETPPQLLSSNPKNESLNTAPKEITLEFSEFIKTDNPSRNIIVTPRIDKNKMEVLANRNFVRIKLHQELEDSTTYVFNFQKSIQDITESNPAKNLKLVFSTGDEIDSLKFSGKVNYLFPQKSKEIKDVLVGLYRVEDDSLDLFTEAPYYISQADSAGNFEITNIKAGKYRAYSWFDGNGTLKAEYQNEPYAFITDTITINKDISNVFFNLNTANLSALKINRTSAIGSNFDVVLSKSPSEISIEHPELSETLFYRIKDKNMRFYHTELRDDSTEVKLMVRDSVGFEIDTTFYAVFETSERKLEKLEVNLDGPKDFSKTIETTIKANKPIKTIRYDSLYIAYDSASYIPLNEENLLFEDSTDRTLLFLKVAVPDSLNFQNFKLFASDSTFFDVENNPNESEISSNFKRVKSDDLADGISGKVDTDEFPILVQLLNKEGKVVRERYLTETNTFEFKKFRSGEYQLRAIIDRNKNKRWDPGNFYEQRQPEPLFYFINEEENTKSILLRGGWTNDGLIIKPGVETGILKEGELPSDPPLEEEYEDLTEPDTVEIEQ